MTSLEILTAVAAGTVTPEAADKMLSGPIFYVEAIPKTKMGRPPGGVLGKQYAVVLAMLWAKKFHPIISIAEDYVAKTLHYSDASAARRAWTNAKRATHGKGLLLVSSGIVNRRNKKTGAGAMLIPGDPATFDYSENHISIDENGWLWFPGDKLAKFCRIMVNYQRPE